MYATGQNATISKYQKLLYKLTGEAIPDKYTANHKCKSGFFKRFITQETSYVTGNGVTFTKKETKDKLGDVDTVLYMAVKSALVQSVSFVFYNFDHLEMYKLTEFVPIFDENSGALRAGIRFWQIAPDKPLKVMLFEEDGWTTYQMDKNGNQETLEEKQTYKKIITTNTAGEQTEQPGGNYSGFPIIPLYGNIEHQSELAGRREQIDCYDLIKSGFANDLDDASLIYWVLTNAGGMDDEDLAKFIERMKTLHAARVEGDDGATAEAHTMDVPYQSREVYLKLLENDLYKDFMALNVESIAAGAVTATQIKAAYDPLNQKADELEMCLFTFFDALFKIAGIEDTPVFERSMISNQEEYLQSVLAASPFTGEIYTTKKLLTILGDTDQIDAVLKEKLKEEMIRFKTLNKKEGEK